MAMLLQKRAKCHKMVDKHVTLLVTTNEGEYVVSRKAELNGGCVN